MTKPAEVAIQPSRLKKRRCLAPDCRVLFQPKVYIQKYCSTRCKSRMNMRALYERAKLRPENVSQQN